MRVFWDKEQHQMDHNAVRCWQEDDPRGYVLNIRLRKPELCYTDPCTVMQQPSLPTLVRVSQAPQKSAIRIVS